MTIEPCDDLEDFFEREEQARRAADGRVQSWQRDIKPGDYFRRDTPYGFSIYGQALEPDGGEYTGLMRHYRFCKAYSVACPEGELGDVHVSVVARVLSGDEFEAAKASGWR